MVHGNTTVRRDDMVRATTTTIRSTPIPAIINGWNSSWAGLRSAFIRPVVGAEAVAW